MTKLHKQLQGKEFWYDDVTLIPNNLPDFERDEVDLSSPFTKKIILKNPFVSSPMDTVTESSMAILMALYGGIGVIHYNFQSIDEQIKDAQKVKNFEAGFVYKPVVLSPEHTVQDVYNVHEKYGFFSVPITKDGTLKTKIVGIVTHRDVRFRTDMDTKLEKVMTPRDKLKIASKKETVDKKDLLAANRILRSFNVDTLPIVDEKDRVVALVADSDLKKNEEYPLATKNENKQLRVFVAVESRLKIAKERISKAFDAKIDGIVIDASVVFKEQLEIAKWAKKNFPKMEIVLGNVVSAKMVQEIMKKASKYCDALRVGIGPGAACITQQELGTGRAQASAVWNCALGVKKLERKYGFMPLIADGGIKVKEVSKPGDIVKALALGASSCMMGSLLAGFDESPGEAEFDYQENRMVKKYRGMGSLEAMEKRSAVRYAVDKVRLRIAEGKVVKVPYRGSGHTFLPKLIVGVKQSLQKQGFHNIAELQKGSEIVPLKKEV